VRGTLRLATTSVHKSRAFQRGAATGGLRVRGNLIGLLALRLLVADLKVLRPLDGLQPHSFAGSARQSQRDLLGGFRLFVEDRLSLPAKASLLVVVPALALRNG